MIYITMFVHDIMKLKWIQTVLSTGWKWKNITVYGFAIEQGFLVKEGILQYLEQSQKDHTTTEGPIVYD